MSYRGGAIGYLRNGCRGRLVEARRRVGRRSGIATAPQKGKPLCVGFSVTLRNAVAFTIANFYPDPLHLAEASYPWERLNAAYHQPYRDGYAGWWIWTSENYPSTHSGE